MGSSWAKLKVKSAPFTPREYLVSTRGSLLDIAGRD